MFARPYDRLYRYDLRDADGQQLNNDVYGLRTNVNWYLEYTYAVKFPPNIVSPPDRPPDEKQIAAHVLEVAVNNSIKFPLCLMVRCIGDADGHVVGPVSNVGWTIERNGNITKSRNQ